MLWLTEDAVLLCKHALGKVGNAPSQGWVTVSGRRVLVRPDPEGRGIGGCPMYGATVKPCLRTLAVRQGYSAFVAIDGSAVCLDAVVGLTDGSPPGTVEYEVAAAGQGLVAGDA
ncbi:MAG TPA: hypothetical protein VFL83_22575 [Anaeromyxobacter sp.]|nr:hypothetical protein [Anaeromyxobacter sp.]